MYLGHNQCAAVMVAKVEHPPKSGKYREQHIQCAQQSYDSENLCYYHSKIKKGLLRSYTPFVRIYDASAKEVIQH
jgi:hypothetical protein